MTEEKVRPSRRPTERHPASQWWLLVKDGNFGVEVLRMHCGGAQVLPVFSGEEEAKMFMWLGGMFEDGWRVRETSAGEFVSLLYGPCAGVGSVALDPSPEMAAGTIGLVSVTRERFVSRVVDSPRHLHPGPGARCHVRGLSRLF